jgi:hypothetical protein
LSSSDLETPLPTLNQRLCGVEAGGEELGQVQVGGAVTQLAVALSQGRASQTMPAGHDWHPQQNAWSHRTKSQQGVGDKGANPASTLYIIIQLL